jgi:hypothetical protein
LNCYPSHFLAEKSLRLYHEELKLAIDFLKLATDANVQTEEAYKGALRHERQFFLMRGVVVVLVTASLSENFYFFTRLKEV